MIKILWGGVFVNYVIFMYAVSAQDAWLAVLAAGSVVCLLIGLRK